MSVNRIEDCAIGISPTFIAETAIPARLCVWITQSTSCRAICTALWMTKPALLQPSPVGSNSTSPASLTLTKHDAVIWS